MLYRLKPIGFKDFLLGTDELGPRHAVPPALGRAHLAADGDRARWCWRPSIGGCSASSPATIGGKVNMAIMRTMDVFFAFPSVLLAVAISGSLGGGIANGMLALTLVFIPPICRVAETATTQVRNLDFVEAARASGASTLSIILHHVLVNVLAPVLVYASSLIVGRRSCSPPASPSSGSASSPPTAGLGPDALHPAPVDLRPAAGLRAAGRRDPHHLDLPSTWSATGCARPWTSRHEHDEGVIPSQLEPRRSTDPRDRGGPAQPMLIVENLQEVLPDPRRRCSTARSAEVQAVDDVSLLRAEGRDARRRRRIAAAASPPSRAC